MAMFYGGAQYAVGLNQTMTGNAETIGSDFAGLVAGAYRQSGIVFACEQVRIQHFSEARFKFRQQRNGRPGDLFGTADLAPLETPWRGGTTGDLLTRMLLHADFAGSAFVVRNAGGVGLLRPDWVEIVIGSKTYADAPRWAPDSEIVGYLYQPGGPGSGNDKQRFFPEQVAHFAPIPDPEAQFRGMSWLRPVVTDITGDRAAAVHKLKFFENGATPSMIVSLDIQGSREEFQAWVDLFREGYEGNLNAYKTLFLQKAVDTKVVGADFQQMDFKATVGVSETRIAAAAGVPPVVVGLSEGLQGSSLNAGNYQSALRRFSDGTMRPLWRNASGSLAQIITLPPGAELWYDDRDIAFLKDDAKDAASVLQIQAASIRTLTDAGFEADSVISAVMSGDFTLLKHSGLFSVQLQPPSATAPAVQNGPPALPGAANGPVPPGTPVPAGPPVAPRSIELERHLEQLATRPVRVEIADGAVQAHIHMPPPARPRNARVTRGSDGTLRVAYDEARVDLDDDGAVEITNDEEN